MKHSFVPSAVIEEIAKTYAGLREEFVYRREGVIFGIRRADEGAVVWREGGNKEWAYRVREVEYTRDVRTGGGVMLWIVGEDKGGEIEDIVLDRRKY